MSDDLLRMERGKLRDIQKNFGLDNYLSKIETLINDLFWDRWYRQLVRAFWHIRDFAYEGLPVALLSCDMEARGHDKLIEYITSFSSKSECKMLIFQSYSKTTKKKNALKEVTNLINSDFSYAAIYIESYEEWDESLVSDLFEIVLEKKNQKHIGFIVDISTDPREFVSNLDMNVSQCLFIEEYRLGAFSAVSKEILHELISTYHLPIPNRELFTHLITTQNEAYFIKMIKQALLILLKQHPEFKDNLETLMSNPEDSISQEIQTFIGIKKQWLDLFQKIYLLYSCSPIEFGINKTDLFIDIYLAEKIDAIKCEYLKKIKIEEFQDLRIWSEYLANLAANGVISQAEHRNILESYEKTPEISGRRGRNSADEPKLARWREAHVTSTLLKNTFNLLNYLPSEIEKYMPEFSSQFILAMPHDIDTNIMRENIGELNVPQKNNLYRGNPQGLHDIQVLFYLLKTREIVVELNNLFDSFVINIAGEKVGPKKLSSLQSRFIFACNELKMLGLLKPSNKKAKTGMIYLEKNFFARSTLYN